MWGDRKLNNRGVKLQNFIREYKLKVINVVGQPPTYLTTWESSYIDVTLASGTMRHFIGDWKVRCDWTTNDYNSIDIRLCVPRETGSERRSSITRFDVRRADGRDLLRASLI